MTTEPKILFLDLDGTLLNDRKEITPGNREAIRAALDAGHKIVIASGRATVSMLSMAEQLSMTREGCYAITFNGACIYDLFWQKPVFRSPLPLDTVRFLLDSAHAAGLHAHTYASRQILAERLTGELRNYAAVTHMQYQIVDDVCQVLRQPPEKVLVIDDHDPQKVCAFRDAIYPQIQEKADCFFSCPTYLEFVSPGVSKGCAIRVLCEYLHIPLKNSISAGDAENDISMLQATHISVIMKNADASMRPFGNYVTEQDNNHDAIAEIIQKFIFRKGEASLC